ncbi:Phosphocarrier protein HPr [anaerobic digester metagenome]|uniref:Phosphocarrier protein HPr n=1 Tax=anaerobic digester metagenome TaxID=1263854 RepID=A0A485M606_9ZZZZ
MDILWSIYSQFGMDYYEMKEKRVTIKNKLGLHARAAAAFSRRASEFASHIVVIKDHMEVNGKSIMELLTLAATKGSHIVIKAAGDDECQAVEALARLVEQGFGEA